MKWISVILVLISTVIHAQTFDKISDYQKVFNVYSGSFAGDVNQDGYDDLIFADKRYITLFLNNGKDSIGFTKIDLGQELSENKNFKLWDVDNDGDLDILMGATGRIILFENQSTTNEPKFVMSSKDFLFFGNFTKNLIQFDLGDVNNDGLYDVVVGYDRTEIYFQKENKSFFKFEPTKSAFKNVSKVRIVDFNNDNKMDILISGNDTTNRQGLVFMHNTFNNFSSRVVLNEAPVSDFFIGKNIENGNVEVSAITGNNDSFALITYNHIVTGDSLTFKDNRRLDLGKLQPLIKFGNLTSKEGEDMVMAYENPAPVFIRNNYENDSLFLLNSLEVLDSVGPVKAIFVSDLDQDGNDDIIVFKDRNGFFIYRQIVETVKNTETSIRANLSPNPAYDLLYLSTERPVDRVCIYDTGGRMICVYEGNKQTSLQLNIQQLKTGVYLAVPVVNHYVVKPALFVKY